MPHLFLLLLEAVLKLALKDFDSGVNGMEHASATYVLLTTLILSPKAQLSYKN